MHRTFMFTLVGNEEINILMKTPHSFVVVVGAKASQF